LTSVVVKSADRHRIEQAVRSYVEWLDSTHPEVEKVIWFGSWVGGLPTPGSDVDLCLIVSESDKRMRDRVCDYLPLGFPVGLDLFPYTREEFDSLQERSPGWYKTIVEGREITSQQEEVSCKEHPTGDYRRKYGGLIEALRSRVIEHYGDSLVSLVFFGSVARGLFRPDSDIDLLIIAASLPRGRAPRVLDFQRGVEACFEEMFRGLRQEGIHPLLSPIIKTPHEVSLGSPLFLDMVEEARISYDRGQFFKKYLEDLSAKLKRMGARKVKFKGGYYWLLKPDYRPGDIIEL
jgi:predicted nucleotidyltransferase